MFKDFGRRLQRDIKRRADARMEANRLITMKVSSVTHPYIQRIERRNPGPASSYSFVLDYSNVGSYSRILGLNLS